MNTATADDVPGGDGLFSNDDMAILNENRRLRQLLIKTLAKDGKVPDDKSDKTMLVKLMGDLDGEVMGRARLKVAAKTEDSVTNLTALVGKALANFKVEATVRTTPVMKTLPDEFKLTDPVPGEMDVGTVKVTLDELNRG